MSQNFYVRWAIVACLTVILYSRFSAWADQVALDPTLETMITLAGVAAIGAVTQGYLTGHR